MFTLFVPPSDEIKGCWSLSQAYLEEVTKSSLNYAPGCTIKSAPFIHLNTKPWGKNPTCQNTIQIKLYTFICFESKFLLFEGNVDLIKSFKKTSL